MISKTRLKHRHLRQLPHLTASRPLPHEETSCVQQLRRWFQRGSNQPSSLVQLLVCFVADVAVSPSPRTPQRTRNSEPANCRTVVCALELSSRVSKSHPVSHRIRSVRPPSSSHVDKTSLCPTFPISARSVCPASFVVSRSISSMKSCSPLFRSIVRCYSFIVFELHWTSLSSSVVEPSLADVPLVSSDLPVPPLGSASLFHCATSVVVSSSPSETFPFTNPCATRTPLAVATL